MLYVLFIFSYLKKGLSLNRPVNRSHLPLSHSLTHRGSSKTTNRVPSNLVQDKSVSANKSVSSTAVSLPDCALLCVLKGLLGLCVGGGGLSTSQ